MKTDFIYEGCYLQQKQCLSKLTIKRHFIMQESAAQLIMCVCVCVCVCNGYFVAEEWVHKRNYILVIVKILRKFSRLFGALPYSQVTLPLEKNDFA